MAQPLMSIVPLLLHTAVAQPPVSPERVTGNLHVNRQSQTAVAPLVTPDPCRVTGNLVGTRSKSPPSCLVDAGDQTVSFSAHLVTLHRLEGSRCGVDGVVGATDGGLAVCTVQVPGQAPVEVPHIAPVPSEGV